jgi:hypothetical protein
MSAELAIDKLRTLGVPAFTDPVALVRATAQALSSR